MKSLLLLIAFYQLAIATKIATVVVDGDTDDSCPSKETLEGAIQNLRLSTKAVKSKFGQIPQCGDEIWYQLVSVNMSTADSQCPDGWMEENKGGIRACGRGTVGASCQPVFLNTDHQLKYTKVCGRAIGYQYRHTDALFACVEAIDQIYVDGLSITYGSPRQHVWTYAAGLGIQPLGGGRYNRSNCPCSSYPGDSPPSFLGNNWYCESGNPNSTIPWESIFFSNDRLWDGMKCEGTCCSNGKSPPWFSVELPAPTDDYIEARICGDEHSDNNEDTFIEIFELYVQ